MQGRGRGFFRTSTKLWNNGPLVPLEYWSKILYRSNFLALPRVHTVNTRWTPEVSACLSTHTHCSPCYYTGITVGSNLASNTASLLWEFSKSKEGHHSLCSSPRLLHREMHASCQCGDTAVNITQDAAPETLSSGTAQSHPDTKGTLGYRSQLLSC